MPLSYNDAIKFLDSFANLERTVPTSADFVGAGERMERLMKRLGNPHTFIPAIHVAGTKGKGSVTNMVAAALSAAGFKTGLYISPHVGTLRERIVLDGRPIDEKRFAEWCFLAFREADFMRKFGNAPSYFEVMTATAFVAFRLAKVDVMVLETGLGGRLDATNLPNLRLVASGITTISMDHEDILGDSLEKIAAEKAGIIRDNVPVVTMPQERGVLRVVTDRAREHHSPVIVVGRDITAGIRKGPTRDKPALGQRLDLETRRGAYSDIPQAMLGRHQADNAAMALGLADLFMEYMDREPLDSLALKRAWRNLILPARLEVAGENPWHIIDGAHNPASAWAAAETIAESFSTRERTLIFGVASDKNWRSMLRILIPLFGRVVLTPFDSPRAANPAELAGFVEKQFPGVRTTVAADPSHALDIASDSTSGGGLILTAGSLYLAGEMRRLIRREKAAAV